jgi:hypothetical protein
LIGREETDEERRVPFDQKKAVAIELFAEAQTHQLLASSTVTIQQITASLPPALSLPSSLSLFSRGIELVPDLLVSDVFGLSQEGGRKLALLAREKEVDEVVDLTLQWETQEKNLSLLAETTFDVIKDYARFISTYLSTFFFFFDAILNIQNRHQPKHRVLRY